MLTPPKLKHPLASLKNSEINRRASVDSLHNASDPLLIAFGPLLTAYEPNKYATVLETRRFRADYHGPAAGRLETHVTMTINPPSVCI